MGLVSEIISRSNNRHDNRPDKPDYTGCPTKKYIQFWRSISNIFFSTKIINIYKNNTLVSVILTITLVFSTNDPFGRNYCTLLTIRYFFRNFNTYFKRRNKRQRLTYLAIFIFLPEVYLEPCQPSKMEIFLWE